MTTSASHIYTLLLFFGSSPTLFLVPADSFHFWDFVIVPKTNLLAFSLFHIFVESVRSRPFRGQTSPRGHTSTRGAEDAPHVGSGPREPSQAVRRLDYGNSGPESKDGQIGDGACFYRMAPLWQHRCLAVRAEPSVLSRRTGHFVGFQKDFLVSATARVCSNEAFEIPRTHACNALSSHTHTHTHTLQKSIK